MPRPARMPPDKWRTAIISAALEYFRQCGYENTTITSIMKKAGGTKALFYRYFDSKIDLLHTMICDWISPHTTKCSDTLMNDGFPFNLRLICLIDTFEELAYTLTNTNLQFLYANEPILFQSQKLIYAFLSPSLTYAMQQARINHEIFFRNSRFCSDFILSGCLGILKTYLTDSQSPINTLRHQLMGLFMVLL